MANPIDVRPALQRLLRAHGLTAAAEALYSAHGTLIIPRPRTGEERAEAFKDFADALDDEHIGAVVIRDQCGDGCACPSYADDECDCDAGK